MEKVGIVQLLGVESLSQLDRWEEIWALVNGFHQKGLVHGDLRLANLIFTKANP
jgi:tRNA A-37 threonylcarbamoyl transferase component Bud32